MIFIGLCNNSTQDGKFILDAVKLEDMRKTGNGQVAYQCEINVPIVYPESNDETRDATVDWMVTLFEQVSERVVQQALVINPNFDLGGYEEYSSHAVRGIRSMLPLILRGATPFASYLRMDAASKPEPGDDLVIMKLVFAVQYHGDPSTEEQPVRPAFLVNFVAAEHWRRNPSNLNKLEHMGLIKGSWEI